MTIENSIKDVITKKLEEGIVEQLVEKHLEDGIKNALKDIFGSWGDGTKSLKKQLESVMIPYLEQYDYSEYITKLDHVLTEVLKNTNTENNQLIKNFKHLMKTDDKLESIKVSDMFDKWIDYVKENVETDGLEVNYDDGVSYDYVNVRYEFNEDYERPSWSIFETGKLIFECEQDKEMNLEVDLSRWKDDRKEGYEIVSNKKYEIKSLRGLSEFEMLLMKLEQDGTKIIIDNESESDDIIPNKEPEASFS